MKDTQKKKITRNYHLLRRVEPWKCCRVTAFICPNWSGILTNAWNISKKKTIFLSPEIVKWNSFMLFLLMMIQHHSKCFECGLHVFRDIHSNGRYGSARVGVSGPKLESNAMLAGGHWRGYPIPQYRKKNWQIPKYRVKNRRNTDTAFIFGHAYLKVYPSRVFVYLKHLRTSNQPKPLQGNVRRPRIQSVQRSKRMPYQFHHRLSVRNCVIIHH